MRLWDKNTRKRLAWLGSFLVIALVVCWITMIWMPLKSFRGPLPPLDADQTALRDELKKHVEKLAGDIGERNILTLKALNDAADYVAASFGEAGLQVTRQTFTANGVKCDNLVTEIPGSTLANEIVVVGAHYDSVIGAPGANDNASGTAAVLVLARKFAGTKPARTLRFIAFVNEEPPFFQTEEMGSLVYARSCRARGDNIVAMLTPETIGYYSDADDSQQYPFPSDFSIHRAGTSSRLWASQRSAAWCGDACARFGRTRSFRAKARHCREKYRASIGRTIGRSGKWITRQ